MEKPKDTFKTEKPRGADEAKRGATPPVAVPKEKPSYGVVLPEVTQSR